MEETKNISVNENKMGTMPIGKLLFSMGAPLMASMLFQALYNVVDSYFVAKLSQDALNAVSLAFPLQTLVISFCGGTGVGMNALLSRSLGAKDQKSVDRAANVGIFLFLCNGLFFALLGLLLAGPFFRFQTDNPEIIRYGTAYIRVCLGCAFAISLQFCTERLLQSTGRSSLSMIAQISGAVCNIILDPIMIFGLFGFPRLEVMGAAVATVVGQCVAVTVGFTLNIKKNPDIHLKLSAIRPHKQTALEIYRIGLPSIVMQSIGSVMTFTMNKILIGFTEAATAVFGCYFKLQSFIFMPVFGLNNAMVPIVAYNYGAKRPDRLKKTVRLSIITAVCIMSVGTALFELLPARLLGFFSPSEEMLGVGTAALRIIGIHFPLAGFCIVAGSVAQALGKPVYALITSVCRQLIVLLPTAFLLSLTGKLALVWFAFPIAEVVSLVMNIFFLRSTLRYAHME